MTLIDPAARRAYQLAWVTARRLAWERQQVCALCGRSGEETRISPHHRSRAEKIDHRVWSWNAERREAELAKCTPLCADCHAAYERGKQMQTNHGTAGMYRRGCSCTICRAYNRDRVRRARAAKKGE